MQLRNLFLIALVFALLFAGNQLVEAAKKGKKGKKAPKKKEGEDNTAEKEPKKPVVPDSKKWNSMNFNDLDKQWEDGDDQAELEMEFERIRQIQASKQPKLDMNDGAAIRKAVETDPFAFGGGGGSMMIFVDLVKTKKWTKNEIDDLCKRYASLLRSGSVVAQTYNIGDDRLMVHIDKVWYTKETLKFLARQPDVESFTANSKTYKPEEFIEIEDEEEF